MIEPRSLVRIRHQDAEQAQLGGLLNQVTRELAAVIDGVGAGHDLALRTCPTAAEDRALRALLYHTGAELLTDWPALFARHGFQIVECRNILNQTLPTWEHALAVCHCRDGEVTRRYGRRLANRILAQLEQIPAILATHGTYPALSAHKPQQNG